MIDAQYIKPFEYGGTDAESNIGVFCVICRARIFYAYALGRVALMPPDDYRPIQIDEAWEPERGSIIDKIYTIDTHYQSFV